MPGDLIQGPFQQYHFLGASINSFQCSAGWGEQETRINVQVYEDPALQDDFLLKEENVFNNGGQAIGTPVRFQVENFIFDGIVEAFEQTNSFSENPGWTITLSSPMKVLNSAEVILSRYVGPVNDSIFNGVKQEAFTFDVSNLINVYGWLESGGSNFGFSFINEVGLLWNGPKGVLNALQYITNLPPTANVIPNAYTNYGSYLVYRSHYYKLDLTGLPVPPDYYRIGGGVINMNLLEMISQFCQEGGVDYLVQLTLGHGNGPHTISFRTVDRLLQPSLGKISTFIRQQNNINSSTHGEELRSDITQAMLVGGNVETLTSLENWSVNDPTVIPFWGFDINGNPIIGRKPDGTFYADDTYAMNLNASSIGDIMGSIGLDTNYPCTILELRCALANYDTWAAFLKNYKNDFAQALHLEGAFVPFDASGIDQYLVGLQQLVIDFVNDGSLFANQLSNAYQTNYWTAVAHRTYEFVKSQAELYYGKQFIVKLPFQLQIAFTDTGLVITNDELSDTGYLPEGDIPLGLNFVNENFFLDDNSKFYPFIRMSYFNNFNSIFTETQGLSPRIVSLEQNTLPEDSCVQFDSNLPNSKAFIKCNQGVTAPFLQDGIPRASSPFIFVPSAAGYYVPAVVVTITNAVFAQAEDVTGNLTDVATVLKADPQVLLNALYSKSSPFNFFIHPPALYPNGVAIALKSNQFVYGPWGKFSANGKIEFDQDDSLVPWECGGYNILNQIALAKIQTIAMGNQVLERASINEAGSPTKSLGDTLVQGGPVLTNIQCTIDPANGVTTKYTMETFVNRIGAFSRENAERLRRVGKVYAKMRRMIRQFVLETAVTNTLKAKNYSGFLYGATYSLQERSPHGVIAGSLFYDPVVDRYYPQIFSQTHQESVKNVQSLQSGIFQANACVGLEGLFRPITLDIYNFSLPNLTVKYNVAVSGVTNKITGMELNPFQSGTDISWILANYQYTRLNKRLYESQLDLSTVRTMALRGPLTICGWGYDIAGNPVPNSGGTLDVGFIQPGYSGQIPWLYNNIQNYNNQFYPNYLSKSIYWPAGALDIRWDKYRGVWASPGMILFGDISGIPLPPGGQSNLRLYINEKPTNDYIKVWNHFIGGGASIATGVRAAAGYDPLTNRWKVIAADC